MRLSHSDVQLYMDLILVRVDWRTYLLYRHDSAVFLKYHASKEWECRDPLDIETVRTFPRPTNGAENKSCLGSVSYYTCFIAIFYRLVRTSYVYGLRNARTHLQPLTTVLRNAEFLAYPFAAHRAERRELCAVTGTEGP